MWDAGNGVCVPISKVELFTNIDVAYNNGEITNKNVSSNTPYEYSQYVPVM